MIAAEIRDCRTVALSGQKSALGTSGGGGEQLLLARRDRSEGDRATLLHHTLRFPVQSQISESTWLRQLAPD